MDVHFQGACLLNEAKHGTEFSLEKRKMLFWNPHLKDVINKTCIIHIIFQFVIHSQGSLCSTWERANSQIISAHT